MRGMAHWCERATEACWLLALVLVPLYFNPLSSNPFEPEKAILLRALGLVGVAAWAAAWALRGPSPRVARNRAEPASSSQTLEKGVGSFSLRGVGLTLVGLFVLAQILSTLLSIAPGESLAGSYERLHGGLTILACLALFLTVVSSVRTRKKLDRLITVALLASFPVAAYGVAQSLGLDPLAASTTGDESVVLWPVRSTLGNHIFVAAYLAMLFPLSLARLVLALQALRHTVAADVPRAQSAQGLRGPLANAAIVVSQQLVLTAYLLGAAQWSQLWWAFMPVLAVVAVSILAVRPGSPSRLGRVLTAAGYGTLLTAQALAIVTSQARGPWLGALAGLFLFVVLLALRRRSFALAGSAVGAVAVVAVFVAALSWPSTPLAPLKRVPVFERLSQLVDPTEGSSSIRLLVWRSAVGLVYLHPQVNPEGDALHWLRPLVGYGPETLQLVLPRTDDPTLAAMSGYAVEWDRAHNVLIDHLTTTGALGLLTYLSTVGLAVLVGLRALRRSDQPREQMLLVAVLSAIGGHLVEGFFGIGVVATLMLQWVLLALLLGPLSSPGGEDVVSAPDVAAPAERPVQHHPGRSRGGDKRKSRRKGQDHPTGDRGTSAAPARPPSLRAVAVLGYVALTLPLALLLAAWAPEERPLGAELGAFAWSLIGMTVALRARGVARLSARGGRPVVVLATLALVVPALLVADFRVSSADIRYKVGETLMARGQPSAALRWFQSAAAEYPRDVYFAALGRVYLQAGRSAPAGTPTSEQPSLEQVLAFAPSQNNSPARQVLFSYAHVSLEQARRLNSLNADAYANLARLSHLRGELGESEQLDVAAAYYATAVALSPLALKVRNEWARVYLSKSDYDTALAASLETLGLNGLYWMTHETLAAVFEARGDVDRAVEEARIALDLGSQAWPKLSQSKLGQLSETVAALERKRGAGS